MRNIIKISGAISLLLLTGCAHQELKSPCHNARLAAAPGANVPCATPQPINRMAYINTSEQHKKNVRTELKLS